MTFVRLALAVLATFALSGCYLFHQAGGGPDAGHGPLVPDASVTPVRDAGRPTDPPPVDAGPPLPAEPDPDLGPDARPSDYPDADEWEDPPPPSDTDPCCVLGEPVLLTSRSPEGMALTHEAPHIAWGPGSWGVLATRIAAGPRWDDSESRPVVFELDADGTPLGAPRVLERAGRTRALHYAEGRWAVAILLDPTAGPVGTATARLFDREWRPASPWWTLGLAGGLDLARLTHADRWLGFRAADDDVVAVVPFHEGGVERGVDHVLGAPPRTLGAVGLRSRAAVALDMYEETVSDEVAIVGPAPELALLARFPLGGTASRARAMAALRDLVVVAGLVGDEVRVDVVDPFALTHVAGPVPIGTSPVIETGHPNLLDVAGSDKYGVAGVCYGVSTGVGSDSRMDSHVEFRVVGPDGLPRGAAVEVVSHDFRSGLVNCSVGSDDYGFLVGWWDGSALWVRRVDIAR
jgi:hypothetical protein